MLLEASDPEIFAVKVEVDFYFEMEEVPCKDGLIFRSDPFAAA